MLSRFQPTGIEQLNKHLQQLIPPPWQFKNWFLSDSGLLKKAEKLIRDDEAIKVYLLSHYEQSTLNARV